MKHLVALISIVLLQQHSFAQKVGIGTNAPSAQLDIVSTLKYRGASFPNLPHIGSLLTSVDDKGNAEWQRPVVFKTRGLPFAQSIPKGSWTKISFKSNDVEINEGFYYDPYNSTFNVPVKGSYHINAQVLAYLNSSYAGIRIVVQRNGYFLKEFGSRQAVCDVCNSDYDEAFAIIDKFLVRPFSISTIIYLEKYDMVWLEAYNGPSETFMHVKPGYNETWFCGALLYRL